MNSLNTSQNTPDTILEDIQFEDLFDLEEIQRIQDLYSDATGVASLIIRADGTPITAPSNFTLFYNDGLYDGETRIVIGGRHLASWLIGQIRNEESDSQEIIINDSTAGGDRPRLSGPIKEDTVISESRFKKVSKMLDALVSELSGNAYANLMLKKQIAEREQTIGLLQENEERYRLIYTNSGEAILFTNPENGAILSANPEACRIFNRSEDEIIHSGRGGLIDMEDPRLEAAVETRRITGKFNGELNFFRKDGTLFPGEVSSTIFIDSLGNTRTSMIIRDISERKKSEMALLESEEKYRMLFHANKDSISITRIDEEGNPANFIEANEAACELLGYTKEELFSFKVKELEVEVPGDIMKQRVESLRAQGSVDFETILKDHQGNERYLDVKVVSISYNNQPALLNITRDISDRKRSEMKLSESEEKFRMMADLLPQVIFETDLYGNFVFVNRQAFKIFGYPEDFEIIGLNSLNFHVPEERAMAKENIRQLISGKNIGGNEYTMLRKDGSSFPGLIYSNPIFRDNKPAGLRGIIIDISDRKVTEKKLVESENRYRLIIESANEGILVGQGAMLKFVNPMIMELTGYEEYELLSRPFLDFIHPDDRNLLLTNQAKRLNGEAIDLRYQIRIVTKNKTIKWIELGGVKIEWEGKPATMNFITDISHRKLAEEEIKLQNVKLRKINAEKDKFFSIIAHDIRSPFSGFLGLTQIMSDELPSLSMAEIQEIAISMKNSAANLFRLLENLLQWSLIQQGQIPFNPREIAIYPIAEECIAIVREAARSKEILIKNDIAFDLTGFADDQMVQTVFRNLISNAVKFTPKGGKIELSAKTVSPNLIEVSVRDNGIGMSPALVDKLFQLDAQTGRKGTDGEASTGLGLLLCKEFIGKHGGKLWVESVEGKGSIFYFTILQSSLNENITSGRRF